MPRFLISVSHLEPELRAFPVAVFPGPQAQDVPHAVARHGQGDADRPVGDLPVADLDVDRVDEHDRVDRAVSSGRFCHSVIFSMTASVIVEIC
jgi:hypothetical protein